MATDGTFTFLPKAGFTGDDTFQYTINDGHGHPVNGTVTVHVTNMVWYVNSANGGAADGRSSSPFTSTASVNAASATGDIVFVYQGTYTGGLTLKDSQQVRGQPAGLTVASHNLVAAGGSRPAIGNTAGNGIALGAGNTIDQVNLGDASGLALSGGAAGTLTISNMTVNNTAGGGASITGGALAVTLDSLTSTGGTNGINLVNDTGNFTVSNAAGSAISGATTAGVSLNQSTVSVTFPGTVTSTSTARSVSVTNKTGGTETFSGSVTDTGTGVAITGNNASTSVTFSGGLSLTTGANTALTATGAGTVTATSGTNSINAATGQALNLSGTTVNATFTGVTSGGGTNNVSLTNVPGTLSLGSGTLSGASGTAFSVNGSNPTVTYQGNITQNNAGLVVDIQNTTGNSVTFSTGTITGGASSLGVNINAANSNVSFANLTLGTSGSRMNHQAVTIAGGNSTSTYTLGTIGVFTTGAQGINATNADGTINITNGTVDASSGRAINISGPAGLTTLGVTLTKVASTSSTTTGLTLVNTGGTFVVNGGGASDPANTTRGPHDSEERRRDAHARLRWHDLRRDECGRRPDHCRRRHATQHDDSEQRQRRQYRRQRYQPGRRQPASPSITCSSRATPATTASTVRRPRPSRWCTRRCRRTRRQRVSRRTTSGMCASTISPAHQRSRPRSSSTPARTSLASSRARSTAPRRGR